MGAYSLGGIQSGGLQSRATDLGSGAPLTRLGAFSLGLAVWATDLQAHLPGLYIDWGPTVGGVVLAMTSASEAQIFQLNLINHRGSAWKIQGSPADLVRCLICAVSRASTLIASYGLRFH